MPDTTADYALVPYPEDHPANDALDPLVTVRLPRLLLLDMLARMAMTGSGWDSRERMAAQSLARLVQQDADADMLDGAAESLPEEDAP